MGIKADAYKKDLCHHLGINSLDEIREQHLDKLYEFTNKYKDREALKDLLNTLPDFLSFARSSINIMKEIVKEIMGFSKIEITTLQSIIIQQEKLLNNSQLTEKQKDKVIELQFQYQSSLDELLKRNHELKKIIISGTVTLAAMALTLTGYWVSPISKGKIGTELLEESAQKLIGKA